MSGVWLVVVRDCHDAIVGIYETRELAQAWRDYFTASGAQCYEVAERPILVQVTPPPASPASRPPKSSSSGSAPETAPRRRRGRSGPSHRS